MHSLGNGGAYTHPCYYYILYAPTPQHRFSTEQMFVIDRLRGSGKPRAKKEPLKALCKHAAYTAVVFGAIRLIYMFKNQS